MVVVGNFRANSELRKSRRKPFSYQATIYIDGRLPLNCAISDISDTGAKLTLDAEDELPEHFMLLLSSTGSLRRHCRRVWCDGLTVGVQFLRTPFPPEPPAAA